MSGDIRELVRYRVERSREAFCVGERALLDGNFHEAVGRLYYACFHLVSALLLIEGHSSGKHRGVLTLFDIHWVNTGRMPSEFERYLHRIYRRRQDADYVDWVVFELPDVELWYSDGREFMSAVDTQIERLLQLDQ